MTRILVKAVREKNVRRIWKSFQRAKFRDYSLFSDASTARLVKEDVEYFKA